MPIYRIEEDGCVSHWVLAATKERAKEAAIENIKLSYGEHGLDDTEEITIIQEPADKLLPLHGETKSITHTVEDWEIIYDLAGLPHLEYIYLGCSEY